MINSLANMLTRFASLVMRWALQVRFQDQSLESGPRWRNAVAAHEELALRYDALIKRLPQPLHHVVTAGRVCQAACALSS